MPRPHAPAIVLIGLAVLTAAVLLFATPRPATVSNHTEGDVALADQLRALTPARGHQSVAATVITPTGVTHASIGEAIPGSGRPITPSDPIELGSITKTFNGFLLADAAARGEVGLNDPLSQHLHELDGSPMGAVTLAELASHRGGVPPFPPSVVAKALPAMLTGANPYGEATRESVLTEVARLEPQDTRGTMAYSNLGATLLGLALADAAGAPDWETYVHDRLLGPLQVSATFAATPAELPADAVPGFTENGSPAVHWTSPAFRPAGAATYVTSAAVATYAQAILTDRVPGTEAMDPRFDASEGEGDQVGLGWFVTEEEGRQLTWHNGGTAGFRTMLVIDRDAREAVFVVGNTDQQVDSIGLDLLTDQPAAAPPTLAWPDFIVPGVAALLIAGAFWSALRGRDRAELISGVAAAVFGLAIARAFGPWALFGGWVWALLAIATAVAIGLGIRRWPSLPWHPQRFRALRWISTAISVVLAATALAVVRG